MFRASTMASLFGIIVAASVTPVTHSLAQAPADPNGAPNPYRLDANWLKIPDGRKIGQVTGVDIDPDGKSIWDGFVYGPEVGAYHARLMFLTAGEWAMNVQFRRDSTKALQRPEDDWRQTVRPAAEPGEATKP